MWPMGLLFSNCHKIVCLSPHRTPQVFPHEFPPEVFRMCLLLREEVLTRWLVIIQMKWFIMRISGDLGRNTLLRQCRCRSWSGWSSVHIYSHRTSNSTGHKTTLGTPSGNQPQSRGITLLTEDMNSLCSSQCKHHNLFLKEDNKLVVPQYVRFFPIWSLLTTHSSWLHLVVSREYVKQTKQTNLVLHS